MKGLLVAIGVCFSLSVPQAFAHFEPPPCVVGCLAPCIVGGMWLDILNESYGQMPKEERGETLHNDDDGIDQGMTIDEIDP